MMTTTNIRTILLTSYIPTKHRLAITSLKFTIQEAQSSRLQTLQHCSFRLALPTQNVIYSRSLFKFANGHVS